MLVKLDVQMVQLQELKFVMMEILLTQITATITVLRSTTVMCLGLNQLKSLQLLI